MRKYGFCYAIFSLLISSTIFAKPLFPSLIAVPLNPKDLPVKVAKADEDAIEVPKSHHKHHHHQYHHYSHAHIKHECN